MPLESLRPAVSVDMRPGDIMVLLSDGIYEYCNSRNEEFGEKRVEDIVRANHDGSAAELAAILLGAVQEFAGNAMQEDDMTVVLVKRKGEG
jgi:serine phosphatase RsbU (regulator of sigma subunit)